VACQKRGERQRIARVTDAVAADYPIDARLAQHVFSVAGKQCMGDEYIYSARAGLQQTPGGDRKRSTGARDIIDQYTAVPGCGDVR
jgi:hypothetical protein